MNFFSICLRLADTPFLQVAKANLPSCIHLHLSEAHVDPEVLFPF